VSTDPNRIKCTGEVLNHLNFHIPNGSQIIKIFITKNEYNHLQQRAKKIYNATSNKLQTLPFSIKKKSKEVASARRDKLIFAKIPEEETLVDVVKSTKPRPNHLPLKLKTVAPESGIVSFDENDSYPDFIGKTTVAQTPLKAITPMVGPISSIFAINEVVKQNKDCEAKKVEKKEWKPIFISHVKNPFKSFDVKKSWNDISECLEATEDYNVYNTITDPFYPIIGEKNRRPMSKSLFDQYQALFSPPPSLISRTEIQNETFKEEPKKRFDNDPMIMKLSDTVNKSSPSRILRNQKKKMLKLPIKSFSLDVDSSTSSGPSNINIFDSPSSKRKLGLQLTPLMSKLTLLAMNENEYLSNESQTTPNHYYETPVDSCNRNIFNRLAKVDEEEKCEVPNDSINSEMKRVELFVHGEKNLTLMIAADENVFNEEIIQQLFDICVNRLSRLEKLNDLINVTYDIKANDYSFVTIDKDWDVLQKSGGSYDLQSTSLMHDQFYENKNLTDIIIKTNDAVIYGHNNGSAEAFFQHPAKLQNGPFPAPSEFSIMSSAKRTLERDQSFVLF
jgi:hypothetical protein